MHSLEVHFIQVQHAMSSGGYASSLRLWEKICLGYLDLDLQKARAYRESANLPRLAEMTRRKIGISW